MNGYIYVLYIGDMYVKYHQDRCARYFVKTLRSEKRSFGAEIVPWFRFKMDIV